MKKTGFKPLLLVVVLLVTATSSWAQSGVLNGQDTTRRPITTAVPFLGFAPDSRASGMGDAGVATDPDANSVHWNNGKLAFIENSHGFSMSYAPWLGKIVDDMALYYLSGFYKIDRVQTIGASMRYFDLGSIQLTDGDNNPLGIENPKEFAFDATYSRKLSESLGIGVTARYINSNLIGHSSGTGKVGQSVAVDLGMYYTKNIMLGSTKTKMSYGVNISNIGQKVTYTDASQEDFIPINLRVGTAWKMELDPFNTLTFAVDFNKLMVPTPPIYARDENGDIIIDNNGDQVIERGKDPNRNLIAGMFGSFTDAPDGFSEEMQEIMIASGVEYWYKDVFAARLGYFYESVEKGGRQYLTIGTGFRYQVFGIDFSYLIPGDQNHPLAETIRFTLLFNFNKVDPNDAAN